MTAEVAPESRRKAAGDRVKVPSRGSKPGERRGGRQKGTPNRVTKDIRESIRELLEQCAPRMAGWLEEVAAKDPGKAIELTLRAAEYVVPKLTRTDMRGGATLEQLICWTSREELREAAERGELDPCADARVERRLHVITGVPDPEATPAPSEEPVLIAGQDVSAPPSPPPKQGGHPIPAAVLAQSDAVLRRGGAAPAPRAASAEPYNPLDN